MPASSAQPSGEAETATVLESDPPLLSVEEEDEEEEEVLDARAARTPVSRGLFWHTGPTSAS